MSRARPRTSPWSSICTRLGKSSEGPSNSYLVSILECQILNKILDELAVKHPKTKFIKAIATKCVENFIDSDCPALFFYRNGELEHHIICARQILGGQRMNNKTVEFVLGLNKMVVVDFEHDPRDKLKMINTEILRGKNARPRHEEDIDSAEEDDREYTSNQYQKY